MNRILVGDVVSGLAQLPNGCVQTCVTSPPYAAMAERRIRTTQPGLALA